MKKRHIFFAVFVAYATIMAVLFVDMCHEWHVKGPMIQIKTERFLNWVRPLIWWAL